MWNHIVFLTKLVISIFASYAIFLIYQNWQEDLIFSHHSSSTYVEKVDYYNPHVGLELPNENNTENGQLFFSELIIFKHILNSLTEKDKQQFIQLMNNTKIKNGLYNRRKNENICRTMSHDNLSGIISASLLLNLKIHEEIWHYLKINNYVYNNCPNDNLPFHPAQYFPWALANNDKFIAYATLPFYTLNFVFTNIFKSKYDTSGKILYFVELYPLRKTLIGGLFYQSYINIMEYRYGDKFLEKMMKIYFFQSKNYPLRKKSSKISNEMLYD